MQRSINEHEVVLRPPKSGDETPIYHLIRQSPPLDPNSLYSYHLLCRHFSDTCGVAEQDGDIVGFISAYIEPNSPDTLFVWQVVVADNQRGQGLAGRMLNTLVARPICGKLRQLESTVNPSNQVSRRLFERFAQQQGCSLNESLFLSEEAFGGEDHEKEILLAIGPLKADQRQEK